MTGIVKTDQLQGAQGTTVTVPTGHTLAVTSNATIGGNLTVDTNTLHVDASNNRVGIGASNNSSYDANARNVLIADESGNTGLTIRSGSSSNYGMIHFADGVSSADEYRAGRIVYEHSSNSMQFSTANTQSLVINGTGAITMPLQPSFQGGLNNTNYTTTGTVIWNVTYHNIGNHYNASTGKFTCPVAGLYYCQIMVMSNGAVTMNFQLEVNDAVTQRLVPYQVDTGGAHNQVSGACIANVSANDTLSFHMFSGSIYGGADGRHSSVTFHLLS